jgi:uncharacterized membrane protein
MNGTTLTHLQYAGYALIAIGFVLMMYSMYFGKTSTSSHKNVSLAQRALKTVCSIGGVMLIGTSTLATTSCQGYTNAGGIQVPKMLAIPTMTSIDGTWVPTETVSAFSPYSLLGVDGIFLMKYVAKPNVTSIELDNVPSGDS